MSLREELQDRADKLDAELLALSGRIRAIERESDDVHTCLNALDLAEMDEQDAALNPASIDYTEQDGTRSQQELEDIAPAQPDPLSAELRSDPGSEENAGTNSDDIWEADETPPAILRDEYDVAEWIASLPEKSAETHTDDVRTAEGETLPDDDRIETQSVTSDPDFVAAVERAEATLAAAEPAYVGLQDPELDADWDAMKKRQDRAADEKPKGFHIGSIFGKVGS